MYMYILSHFDKTMHGLHFSGYITLPKSAVQVEVASRHLSYTVCIYVRKIKNERMEGNFSVVMQRWKVVLSLQFIGEDHI